MRFDFLSNFCLKNFSFIKIEQDIVINVCRSSPKAPVIHVRVLCNLTFLDSFCKNAQIPNLLKIRPTGAQLFHADGQTDITKLIVAFRNFSIAPKISNNIFWDVILDTLVDWFLRIR
jgi:hypothetical protein